MKPYTTMTQKEIQSNIKRLEKKKTDIETEIQSLKDYEFLLISRKISKSLGWKP